jgi:hypothetical protein
MTTSSLNHDLTCFDKPASEINLVATVKFPPEHFIQSHQLKFASGHDDLDSLIFTNFNLPSGNTISLVRHQNAPYPGTELYLAPGLLSPSTVLAEALHILNISRDDLDWIHPQANLAKLI